MMPASKNLHRRPPFVRRHCFSVTFKAFKGKALSSPVVTLSQQLSFVTETVPAQRRCCELQPHCLAAIRSHFRALPVALIVRFGNDVLFQIIACGDEMMPPAMRSAYGGANRCVLPHQHDCARDGFSSARSIEKVLQDFDHPRFDSN